MKFLAISDTHDNIYAIRDLIEDVKKERVDFIVHAGDVISPFAIRELGGLERIAEKIYIAFGNNDGDRGKLVEIALTKGWIIGDVVAFPGGCAYHGTNPDVLKLLTRQYQLVVTGHTHKKGVEKGDALVINPGEVCGYLSGVRSYAIADDGDVSIIEF